MFKSLFGSGALITIFKIFNLMTVIIIFVRNYKKISFDNDRALKNLLDRLSNLLKFLLRNNFRYLFSWNTVYILNLFFKDHSMNNVLKICTLIRYINLFCLIIKVRHRKMEKLCEEVWSRAVVPHYAERWQIMIMILLFMFMIHRWTL